MGKVLLFLVWLSASALAEGKTPGGHSGPVAGGGAGVATAHNDRECEELAKKAATDPNILAGLPWVQTKNERNRANRNGPGAPPPAFKKNEKISGKFLLRVDEKRKKMQLYTVTNGAHTDTWDLPASDIAKYACLEGFPIEGTVEVTGDGNYVVSNRYSYPGKIVALKRAALVNPDQKEEPGLSRYEEDLPRK